MEVVTALPNERRPPGTGGFLLGLAYEVFQERPSDYHLLQETVRDIGTPGLGGPNSEAFGDNERGQAVGQVETSTLDPNGEDFRGFGTHLTCLPFLWEHGVMTALPTLGGNNGEAEQINNRGEVAGLAENSTPDPSCPAPQVLQFKPAIWEKGEIQELPTFPGDPDGFAFGINDNDQVVGASGICTKFNPITTTSLLPIHALLWEKGTVTDLGNLGGTNPNWAIMANNQGQVVGSSALPGNTTGHAFLWTRETGIQDLGTLPGDVSSGGIGINNSGEVVGVSGDASGNLRAFFWQNGVMTDLNTRIPADSPLFLLLADDINSRGEIVGFGVQKSTGDVHAFLATPIHSEVASESAKSAAQGETREGPKIALPENVRELLQQRLRFGRFGARLTRPQ